MLDRLLKWSCIICGTLIMWYLRLLLFLFGEERLMPAVQRLLHDPATICLFVEMRGGASALMNMQGIIAEKMPEATPEPETEKLEI
jgi:hypothetical protein